jgi:hypothetical protein
MIIQLLIFALLFMALGVWFFIKKRKPLAVTFILLGLVTMMFFFIVRWLHPHTVPF